MATSRSSRESLTYQGAGLSTFAGDYIMTQQQKHQAFLTVRTKVAAMENRWRMERIQHQARATVSAQYAEMVAQREQARRTGGFSFLK